MSHSDSIPVLEISMAFWYSSSYRPNRDKGIGGNGLGMQDTLKIVTQVTIGEDNRVGLLVDFLCKGPADTIQQFSESLEECDQRHVVESCLEPPSP